MAGDASSSWLTITDLADRIGVSDTTIRNWRRAYGALIPEAVGTDGVRRYPPAPFERIAVLRQRNLPPAAIRAALASSDAPVEPPAPEDREERLLALLERIATDVRRIADHLDPPAEDA